MEDVNASGMISMFLSGDMGQEDGKNSGRTSLFTEKRRLMIACEGSGYILSGTAKNMAYGLGRKNAMTTMCKTLDPGPLRNLGSYDGIFIGIAPDGSGSTERAFSFIRNHLDELSAMPVALFFLLSRAPKLGTRENLFADLSHMHPLDVQIFDRSSACLGADVADWAENKIWPLMETGWLADLIFPEPALADRLPEPVLSIA